jgi:hypothetical protein
MAAAAKSNTLLVDNTVGDESTVRGFMRCNCTSTQRVYVPCQEGVGVRHTGAISLEYHRFGYDFFFHN